MTKPTKSFNLVRIILSDLLRHPLQVTLFLLVLVSAAAVVLSSHENRQRSIVLEQLMQERDRLDIEWRHLVLEQSALTEHNRIETLVKKQLDMHRPSPDEEVVVRIR
ncbi:cell division protein FtsL [Alteromonadaceae bacterium M269]|nr:cell division protein FtsL [Alteromonadaceae bacterium M269]